jgi:hypothetical protein
LKSYLVVAHYEGDHRVVDDLIRARMAQGPARFFLLVPATPPRTRSLTWNEEQARELANERLNFGLKSIRALGADVTGAVGDVSIADAILDALRAQSFDEVILATPPATITEQFLGNLATQVKRIKDIPITHVVIPEAHTA